jgi:nucleoside phosphorylase
LGTSAAGDQFVNSTQHIDRIRQEGADFLEMESGAIAQVAQKNAVSFLNVRAISDRGGDSSMTEFFHFLDATADLSGRVLNVLFDDPVIANYFLALTPIERAEFDCASL